ncbi:putative E3 ubiquitin-protein ligase XBAT31 [Apium graveolens]|uniref:putative E3 ubiquitin-protein ligase XBAT31 n=1 Tax=Apium graveolens TaxID=4045 RepID=UPI003D7BF519
MAASVLISDAGLCFICFDQVRTIEVQDCGHQMCAHCTLALCCHNKTNPIIACLTSLACSFKNLSAVSSFGRMGTRGSGRIAAENEWVDKP